MGNPLVKENYMTRLVGGQEKQWIKVQFWLQLEIQYIGDPGAMGYLPMTVTSVNRASLSL